MKAVFDVKAGSGYDDDITGAGQSLRGRSTRAIDDADFNEIVLAGLSETLAPEDAIRLGLDFPPADPPPIGMPFGAEAGPRRRG